MSDNPTERTYFLQTISMYKELVREVILKTFQFAIHSEDISQFLSSHETKIKLQEFIRNGIFNKADSNKLQTLNPNPDKFDIALLIKLIIYLGDIDEPERGWHTDPNPTDESTGADLIRLKNIRNKLLAHDPNEAKLSKDECERVFAKVKAILTRILAKIDHESKESLNERLLEYRQLNVVTEKSEIKQYIEELSAVYKNNEKRKKEVEELVKTVKELKLYFEKTPELYVRYVKLLYEGGRVVLHGFLEKEVAKVEKDLATLLFENRPTLMVQVHSDFHEKMFGGNNNYQLDPASWDIDLLASVIVILSPNLSEDDASNIRVIQNARRDYLEHALISLDSADFIPYWTDLVSSLTSLSASLERGKKSEVKCLIDRYKNKSEDADADRYFRELTNSRVTTKTLKDFYKETVARLVKYLEELEENGQKVKKEYLNLDLKLMVDCKNEKTRELVEDVLEEHFKASLAKSKKTVNCIREQTDSLLHKITANPTVTITGVKRGCIILSFRTSTIHGLLYLIQLFESQQFRSILDSLSAELYYLYGETCLLHGHIPFECLDRVLQQFKVSDSRETKPNKGVSLQIQCSSIEGIQHVLSVAGDASSEKSLIDISDKISREIKESISVDIVPDILTIGDVSRMEEIFEYNGTRNVDKNATEMYVDDTNSEMAHRQVWTSNQTPRKRRHSNVLDSFDYDVQNYEIYQKVLSEGVEKDNSIRVNVVGNFAQGKTSLVNILVGKDLESVQSTNSVEISSCKYSYDHEGVKFCSQISSSDDIKYQRFCGSFEHILKVGNKSNQSTDNSKLIKLNEESGSLQGNIRRTGLKKYIGNCSPKSRDYREVSRLLPYDPLDADGDVHFWDFGGQFVFYATHTLFHSKASVYLMVFDLTKSLSDVIEDPEFPNESVGKSIQQSAEFWIRSIHTYVGSDDGLQPPVILVGTHKDLLKGNENMNQNSADHYFEEIRMLFEDTPMINHIQGKHFTVDCTNPCDGSIGELRKEIIRLGSSSNLHGQFIPARWSPLEKELLAKKHKNIILYSEVVEIDEKNEFPLKDEEKIKQFLLYHHTKGNLIYFDEEPLAAYVVLDTQYVIDAFKCIITSERFCKREPTYRPLWKTLRQEAKLNMLLLEKVWSTDAKNNFLEHKDVLLMLMKRTHIILEALSYDDGTEETKGLGWYVVPCFLRSYRTNNTLKEFVTGRQQTMLKFVMSFNIYPVVELVYYRVIAALIGKWEIVSVQVSELEKQVLLFDNLGVFKLDRQHVGIIELHQGSIDLRVQNLCNSGISAAIVDLFRRFVVSNVMNEFRKHRQTSTMRRTLFEICFKCNHESHGLDGSQQTVSVEDLKGTMVEPCPDIVSGHTINTRKALYEWFPDDLNIDWKLI
ncbi:uncharacterized protein LOC132744967 [Ruditapes philippinarum]|uniref:uncharacterized protein LOC132744967 n=1 Tax=Ruditapes philippinarum TaxID=129788 RepID=UPI00295B7176|nr:uncharacterized protein LOC132744967 [Ruditapes philippinarum]XP_060589760.1 uncharacterized protein LOC132744967 [Ruditapes philippinarum]